MPENVNRKDPNRSKIKDIRKGAREESRLRKKETRSDIRETRKGITSKADTKAGELVDQSANKAGIDLKTKYKAPLSEPAKNRITEGLTKAVYKDEAASYMDMGSAYSKAHPNANFETPNVIDEEYQKQQAKRQRRMRYADAIYAFGEGLQGRTADREKMGSVRIQRERDAEFQKFKDVTERNKTAKSVAEKQYFDDYLSFLDKQIADETNSDAVKQKALDEKDKMAFDAGQNKLDRESRERLADKGNKTTTEGNKLRFKAAAADRDLRSRQFDQTNEVATVTESIGNGQWSIKGNTDPYTSLYNKIEGSSPQLLNDLAGYTVDAQGNKKSNLTSEVGEQLSDAITNRMYDFKTDPKTKTRVATPKPGMENFLSELGDKVNSIKAVQQKIDELESGRSVAKEDGTMVGRLFGDTQKYNVIEYNEKINVLQRKINQYQDDITRKIGGLPKSQPVPEAPTTSEVQSTQTGDILDLGF